MSAIISELRRGARTTSELMEATGLSRAAVESAIRRERGNGHEIVNVRRPGGHGVGLYWLARDNDNPGVRRCAAPGCGTVLSHSNGTRWCRRHLPGVALMLYVEQLLDGLGEADEQLELVGGVR